MTVVDHLARIVARKRIEVQRRSRFALHYRRWAEASVAPIRPASDLLRRHGDLPGVIAEVKFRSPSAGVIRARQVGAARKIACAYERAGAGAVSVLCDGPGFGGCPLDLRRVARDVSVPVLFKEFVVDALQVDLARAVGAHMVLLLVNCLDETELPALVEQVHARGLDAVVEAANAQELQRALATSARIVGINARDLHSFQVDAQAALRLVDRIPEDRVAVLMSGIKEPTQLRSAGEGRADAVLVGEGLMRAPDPGLRLAALRNEA